MKAASIPHAEYEILLHIVEAIDISEVRETLVQCEHSATRFRKAATSVLQLIENMAERRRHNLPKKHIDYVEKGT